MQILEILLTVASVMGLLVAMHYFPWRMIHGKSLHPIWNYILGVLAINLPFSALLAMWEEWLILLVIWLCVVFGGGAVMLSYALDSWLLHRARAQIAERETRILKSELDHDARPD